MKPMTQKILGWSGMAIGLGGTGLFFLFVVSMGPPPDWIYWIWPVVTGAVLIGSWLITRHAYRRQADPSAGAFQFRLSDLLMAVLATATLFAIGHAIWGDEGFTVVGPVSIGAGAMLIVGFMVSNQCHLAGESRYVFSFGFPFLVYSALSLGAAIVLFIVCALDTGLGRGLHLVGEMLLFQDRDTPVTGVIAGVWLSPVGFCLCLYGWRRRPKK